MWCIPPAQDARFVAAMEDVLEVYERPFDPECPLVCLDEGSKQILSDKREAIQMKPTPIPIPTPIPTPIPEPASASVTRYDNEYERQGTCSLFMLSQPLLGQREVLVRDRRTGADYAQVVRYLCDEVHPDAKKIVLVQDNLNTHGPWSLYQAFEPQEAQRLIARIEWHYTPKHGSWLNMAEIELGVLSRQCLQERMESRENLEEQVQAWQTRRNAAQVRIEWRFGVQDARCKLKRLYPVILPS
jgi:hypothetical protein